MKIMSKKITTLALAGLMVATPIANLAGLTAEAATVNNRTVKVKNVPGFTTLQGYTVKLVENGKVKNLGSTKTNGSFSTKTSLKDTTYYVEICYKNVGTGKVLPSNCIKTNKVKIDSKKLKKADLEVSVNKKGPFISNATAQLKVKY